ALVGTPRSSHLLRDFKCPDRGNNCHTVSYDFVYYKIANRSGMPRLVWAFLRINVFFILMSWAHLAQKTPASPGVSFSLKNISNYRVLLFEPTVANSGWT